MALFDMEKDPYETTNVLEQHADVARRLKGYAEAHRREFFPDQAPVD
jgi:arylsulfatase A